MAAGPSRLVIWRLGDFPLTVLVPWFPLVSREFWGTTRAIKFSVPWFPLVSREFWGTTRAISRSEWLKWLNQKIDHKMYETLDLRVIKVHDIFSKISLKCIFFIEKMETQCWERLGFSEIRHQFFEKNEKTWFSDKLIQQAKQWNNIQVFETSNRH